MDYSIWESCMLFPGFSRAECASWVQAWGSIGAIGVAIWLGNRSETEAKRTVVDHYNLFKLMVRQCLDDGVQKASAHDLQGILYVKARLHDAVKLGDTVTLDKLPRMDMLAASEYRAIVTEASEFLDRSIATSGNALSFQHIQGEFSRMLKDLA